MAVQSHVSICDDSGYWDGQYGTNVPFAGTTVRTGIAPIPPAVAGYFTIPIPSLDLGRIYADGAWTISIVPWLIWSTTDLTSYQDMTLSYVDELNPALPNSTTRRIGVDLPEVELVSWRQNWDATVVPPTWDPAQLTPLTFDVGDSGLLKWVRNSNATDLLFTLSGVPEDGVQSILQWYSVGLAPSVFSITMLSDNDVTGKDGLEYLVGQSRIDRCPRCGSLTLREHWVRDGWTGRMVCHKCFDPADPLDSRKSVQPEDRGGINSEG